MLATWTNLSLTRRKAYLLAHKRANRCLVCASEDQELWDCSLTQTESPGLFALLASALIPFPVFERSQTFEGVACSRCARGMAAFKVLDSLAAAAAGLAVVLAIFTLASLTGRKPIPPLVGFGVSLTIIVVGRLGTLAIQRAFGNLSELHATERIDGIPANLGVLPGVAKSLGLALAFGVLSMGFLAMLMSAKDPAQQLRVSAYVFAAVGLLAAPFAGLVIQSLSSRRPQSEPLQVELKPEKPKKKKKKKPRKPRKPDAGEELPPGAAEALKRKQAEAAEQPRRR